MINLARTIIAKIELFIGLPIKRAIKFSLVGSSGIIMNMGIFFMINEFAQLTYQISSLIAIEMAIINNFIWNNTWTWKDRKTEDSKEKKVRFLKYQLINGFSALINYGLLIFMVEVLSINKYISNFIGILVAMSFNFILNHKWTFKKNVNL